MQSMANNTRHPCQLIMSTFLLFIVLQLYVIWQNTTPRVLLLNWTFLHNASDGNGISLYEPRYSFNQKRKCALWDTHFCSNLLRVSCIFSSSFIFQQDIKTAWSQKVTIFKSFCGCLTKIQTEWRKTHKRKHQETEMLCFFIRKMFFIFPFFLKTTNGQTLISVLRDHLFWQEISTLLVCFEGRKAGATTVNAKTGKNQFSRPIHITKQT